MTNLKKQIRRTTNGVIREAGKTRPIIVILEPPNLIGFKAKGCKKIFWLTVETGYVMAVRIEVLAKQREKAKKKKIKQINRSLL